MGEESRSIEWQDNDNLRDQGGSPDRCLKEGLRSVLPRQIDRLTMDITGERYTHKCFRIEGSEIGPSDICKDPPNGQSSFSDKQYDSSILFSENGRDPKQGDGNLSQGDLGLCSIQKDHDYCGISSRKVEHRGRLGFKAFSGLEQVTTIPKVIPRNLQKARYPIGRSFCIKGMSSTTLLHSLEGRPIESGDRRI